MVRKYSLFVLCSIGFKNILIDKTIDKQQSCSWKIPFHLSICHNSTLYTDREIGLNIAKMQSQSILRYPRRVMRRMNGNFVRFHSGKSAILLTYIRM